MHWWGKLCIDCLICRFYLPIFLSSFTMPICVGCVWMCIYIYVYMCIYICTVCKELVFQRMVCRWYIDIFFHGFYYWNNLSFAPAHKTQSHTKHAELHACGMNSGKHLSILYHPVLLSHFSPAPVKTDRAVRIQQTNQVKIDLSSIDQSSERFVMKVCA